VFPIIILVFVNLLGIPKALLETVSVVVLVDWFWWTLMKCGRRGGKKTGLSPPRDLFMEHLDIVEISGFYSF